MPVAAPAEGYMKMIAYGRHKASLGWDKLILQSIAAGIWIAIYGHCRTVFAGYFYTPTGTFSGGLTKLAYGSLFPGAFVAVVYTGTELFTGNTVTMFMLMFNDGVKKTILPLLRIWTVSFFGNFAGAVFGGFLISFISGAFDVGTSQRAFLFNMVHKKCATGFGANIVLGIGCNSLVCLATWCVTVSDDGAGKVLAIFYSVGVFAMGGFEHVIANMYTITTAHMLGFDEHTYVESLWKNFLPVLIGNLMAGTMFTGCLWWYALHPQFTDLAPFSNEQLAGELTRRMTVVADVREDPALQWKRRSTTILAFTEPLPSPSGESAPLVDKSKVEPGTEEPDV